MNGTPLVSVIFSVYNKEGYVGECVDSVLNQTYANWELIVVDDASTDGSLTVLRQVRDPRLRLVALPVNSRRPAAARNKGVELARGKYLAFLDGDDRWEPAKLDKQVAYMEAHPEFRFSHAACWKMDARGERLGVRHEGTLPPAGPYGRALLDRVWVSISTVMVTRSLMEQVGGFDEHPLWRGEEDAEFFLRCAARTPFGVLTEPLASYRGGTANLTAEKNWRGVGRDFPLYRHIWETPELWEGILSRREMRSRVLDMAEEGAFCWRSRGRFGRAAWFVWQMIRLSPFASRGWKQGLAVGLRRR